MTTVPPFLPEVMAHWQVQLDGLRSANESAAKYSDYMDRETRANRATAAQLAQAQLQQLQAAQTYNSFIESGSHFIKTALDAESRLQRRNLSLLEIIQLTTTRDTMYTLASEFTQFKTDNQATLLHLRPVETGGQIHYIDGRVEWSGSWQGLAGQAWEGLQEVGSVVKEALLRGPFTVEENYAICQSALGGLLPQLAGKTIAAPGSKPGDILWGEALSKALDAADPGGQMCRVVYPPGTSPQEAWRFGQVIEGFDPVTGTDFTAVVFMPPEMAEARGVSYFVETGMDEGWNGFAEALSAFTGLDGMPLFDAADAWSAGGEAPEVPASSSAPDEAADCPWDLADFAPGIGSDQLWFRQPGLDGEASALGNSAAPADAARNGEESPVMDGPLSAEGQALFSQLMDVMTNSMADFSPPAAGQPHPVATPYASVLPPVLASNWT